MSRDMDEGAPLTAQQKQTLVYIAKGLQIPAIAQLETRSPHTIASRVKAIYQKIGVNNRAEAAVYACKQGLV